MSLKLAEKPGYFGRLFQRFMDYKDAQEGVSQKTLEIYESAWKFFAPGLAEDNDPFQAPPTSQKDKEKKIIEGLQRVILERKRRIPPTSNTTINIYTRCINTFLRWLYEYDDELTFPWKLKKQIVETGDTRDIFTDDEVTKIRFYKPATFNQRRAQMIGLTMLDNGMRINEALSLTLQNVDFRSEIIFIDHGKGRKSRHVEITPLLKPTLHRYIDKTMPNTARFVFGTATGTKLSQRNALRDIGVVLRKAKVRELSWHCFRHTYGTGYILREGHVEKLKKILGHARIETTMIYVHMAESYHQTGNARFSSLTPVR